ncbi:hypothetical protein F7725_028161 [Dissostichus mawsoni]|uniref:Uncharacterized protein n=1 Tax=Dissostichus mawsoni TaxID=36200 RepID=A0A7J5XFM0_DISMA|nr:hypothetical protein F7725_028161 [Dissostichus mawsoni]
MVVISCLYSNESWETGFLSAAGVIPKPLNAGCRPYRFSPACWNSFAWQPIQDRPLFGPACPDPGPKSILSFSILISHMFIPPWLDAVSLPRVGSFLKFLAPAAATEKDKVPPPNADDVNIYLQWGVNIYLEWGVNICLQWGVNIYLEWGVNICLQWGFNICRGVNICLQWGVNICLQWGFNICRASTSASSGASTSASSGESMSTSMGRKHLPPVGFNICRGVNICLQWGVNICLQWGVNVYLQWGVNICLQRGVNIYLQWGQQYHNHYKRFDHIRRPCTRAKCPK